MFWKETHQTIQAQFGLTLTKAITMMNHNSCVSSMSELFFFEVWQEALHRN